MFNNKERDKMINEKSLESKVLKMDCYDQELWIVDNTNVINNSSNEFKSFIKGLDFETGQTALENSNADYYAQTVKEAI